MFRGIIFTAMLFCVGLVGLFVGGMALYENAEWHFKGSDALMELANPDVKIKIPVGGWDVHLVDVKYISSAGEIVVPRKALRGDIARKLVDGERIPVRYMTSEPSRVMFSRDELPSPWGWLLAGIAAMFTAFLSRKALHRESSN